MLGWEGEDNTFAGWSDWLSVGTAHSVRVPDLSAARAVWTGTDPRSLETPTARPLAVPADHAGPEALRILTPERTDVLSRVAVPSPLIHEKTIEPFPHPFVPGLTRANGTPLVGPTIRPNPDPAPSILTPGVRELTFDAETPPWSGDLGRFLAAMVKTGDTLVRVRAKGTGPHAWSAFKVPEGVSVEIAVIPGPGGRVPSWTAARSHEVEALLDLSGGSLVLSEVILSRDGRAGLKSLVRVTGGHLVIQHSRLISRGTTESGGGGLIEFHARGSKPLKPLTSSAAPWPFEVATDRPTCRLTETVLITGGDVVTAEVGRGIVALSHCAVAAGSTAFSLRPVGVARRVFEADLWLDHCTVASERSFVSLGPWPGAEPGPDRPWLVSTHRTGFFSTYDRRSQESVLLRVDPDSFAHGTLFWQAGGDAFEVAHFASPLDASPPLTHRPDVTRQWAELWGRAHVHSVTGPHPPTGLMTRWLINRLLKPGEVLPGDLAIDPTYPKDDPPTDLGVDLTRLGITPSPRTVRRR